MHHIDEQELFSRTKAHVNNEVLTQWMLPIAYLKENGRGHTCHIKQPDSRYSSSKCNEVITTQEFDLCYLSIIC